MPVTFDASHSIASASVFIGSGVFGSRRFKASACAGVRSNSAAASIQAARMVSAISPKSCQARAARSPLCWATFARIGASESGALAAPAGLVTTSYYLTNRLLTT